MQGRQGWEPAPLCSSAAAFRKLLGVPQGLDFSSLKERMHNVPPLFQKEVLLLSLASQWPWTSCVFSKMLFRLYFTEKKIIAFYQPGLTDNSPLELWMFVWFSVYHLESNLCANTHNPPVQLQDFISPIELHL